MSPLTRTPPHAWRAVVFTHPGCGWARRLILCLGERDGETDVRYRIRAWRVRGPASGKRGACLHAALVARPGSCIRRLGGTRAREMQFTRFLRNRSVTAAAMSRHAGEQTAGRVSGREVVAIQDTSELVLGGRRARSAGYGPVGKGGALGGLLLHPVLAVEVGSEALLGLVSMQVWNRPGGGQRSSRRERKTAAKESQRWIDGMRQAGDVLASASGRRSPLRPSRSRAPSPSRSSSRPRSRSAASSSARPRSSSGGGLTALPSDNH